MITWIQIMVPEVNHWVLWKDFKQNEAIMFSGAVYRIPVTSMHSIWGGRKLPQSLQVFYLNRSISINDGNQRRVTDAPRYLNMKISLNHGN